jgi:transposase
MKPAQSTGLQTHWLVFSGASTVQAAMLEPANQLQQAQADIDHLNARIHLLEQENRWLKQQLFGRSSEKRSAPVPANQSWLFQRSRSGGGASRRSCPDRHPCPYSQSVGRAIADNLPRVDVIHDLPEAEKICPKDGAVLGRIGEEESQQIDYIPARIQVLRHIRLKYACPVARAISNWPTSRQILPKSNAAPSLLGPYRLRQICRQSGPSIFRKSNSTALA